MKRVMVAMSGGVDSSVAALLLQEQGCEICGVTLKLFDNKDICSRSETRTCCSLEDIEDARSVCHKMLVPHYVFNFRTAFKSKVIDRFVFAYKNGETPNPCIDCNRYIKFEAMLKKARILGYDQLATGHYARIFFDQESNRYLLLKAKDQHKDQSYVLYGLTQEQLANLSFPLGDLSKDQVRAIAKSSGFVNASKPDSQDICFVRDGDYNCFIEDYTGERMPTGQFFNKNGELLGTHQGMARFTIGQRKGLGKGFGHRLYVCAKDALKNTVTLGEEKDLYSTNLIADDLNWISIPSLQETKQVKAKIRYQMEEQEAMITPLKNGEVLVRFLEPQRAIAPGQAVVFYENDVVIGGGTIKERGDYNNE
ncbi:MAG: tRNA 2-thiouridine(34) synthase MnmA [Clostridia bacterium]